MSRSAPGPTLASATAHPSTRLPSRAWRPKSEGFRDFAPARTGVRSAHSIERGGTMRMHLRGAALATLVLAALSLAAGIAYATIPDGDGTIHGCYRKSGGALRVIDNA